MTTAIDDVIDPPALLDASQPVILTGDFSDRPAATAVPAWTQYAPVDVPELYLSDGTAWRVLAGAGDELGYAEAFPMVSNPDTTPMVVPGLSVTFLAGERPVTAHLSMRLASATAGSRADASLRLDGVEIARIEQTASVADRWQSETLIRRLPRLVPGTTHTVDVAIYRGFGPGIARTAGDATNPNTLQVVTS